MDRTACVDIRALPLQLLLRAHPDWREHPVVVVDRDKPLGVIQWTNRHAAARQILPGMRYATGLSLARDLRGGVTSHAELTSAIDLLAQRLWRFSPRVEPSDRNAGIFWLDASGLRYLYPSLDTWASAIRADLSQIGFRAVVAVGFTRFGSYAAARARTENIVFADAGQETAYLRRVSLERLELTPQLRDTLLKLGVTTLGQFIALPAAGIRKRFGAEAEELHGFARGDGWAPLVPRRLLEAIEYRDSFDYPEDNRDRLIARIAILLQSTLMELTIRHEALKTAQIFLALTNHREHREEVSPASPTLDANQILLLIRLRLDTLTLCSGVVEVRLGAEGVAVSQGQLALFQDAPQRNEEAVHRAFAKLRAEFGANAVQIARLSEGHLPEATYVWEPLAQLPTPKPCETLLSPLVRRIYTPVIVLPPRVRHEPDGWLISGIADGPVEEVIGPHIVSGGWWAREVSRAYHYVRTRSGRWLWIYHDEKRRRWFLQGEAQ